MLYNGFQCILSMAIEFGAFIADDRARQRCHGLSAAAAQWATARLRINPYRHVELPQRPR